MTVLDRRCLTNPSNSAAAAVQRHPPSFSRPSSTSLQDSMNLQELKAKSPAELLAFAEELQIADSVLAGLERMVVASIGPTTSEELRSRGIPIDLESSHPKMGFLVREAADCAADILERKRT